jgi:hypothetical protein
LGSKALTIDKNPVFVKVERAGTQAAEGICRFDPEKESEEGSAALPEEDSD